MCGVVSASTARCATAPIGGAELTTDIDTVAEEALVDLDSLIHKGLTVASSLLHGFHEEDQRTLILRTLPTLSAVTRLDVDTDRLGDSSGLEGLDLASLRNIFSHAIVPAIGLTVEYAAKPLDCLSRPYASVEEAVGVIAAEAKAIAADAQRDLDEAMPAFHAAVEAPQTGIVVLGGGVVKHHVCNAQYGMVRAELKHELSAKPEPPLRRMQPARKLRRVQHAPVLCHCEAGEQHIREQHQQQSIWLLTQQVWQLPPQLGQVHTGVGGETETKRRHVAHPQARADDLDLAIHCGVGLHRSTAVELPATFTASGCCAAQFELAPWAMVAWATYATPILAAACNARSVVCTEVEQSRLLACSTARRLRRAQTETHAGWRGELVSLSGLCFRQEPTSVPIIDSTL